MNPNIQTEPIQVLPTKLANEYLVLVNWYELPLDVSEINTTIFKVKLTPEGFDADPLYDLEERIMSIQYSKNQEVILALTTDGRILKLKKGKVKLEVDIDRFSNHMLVDEKQDVIWVAHDDGIAEVSNGSIRYIEFNTEINHLYRLTNNNIIAVGDKGLVLQLIDEQWQKVVMPRINKRLVSAFQSLDGKVWISGWGGILFQWDLESIWRQIKTKQDYIYSVGQFKNDIYVCCSDGVCMVNDDSLKFVKNTFYPSRIHTASDRIIFLGGGELIHFSGSSWTGGDFNFFD